MGGSSNEPLRVCTRCVYDDTLPNITFDKNGVCNYCHQHDEMCRRYPAGDEGRRILEEMARRIKRDGRGKKFDCVVGVSGGCDSSYMLHTCVRTLGLRCLAVNFDNGGWGTEIAARNLRKVTEGLRVPLETVAMSRRDYDGMVKAFLTAGLPDFEAPADIGIPGALYRVAAKHGLKHIMEGHNFRTEGISPLGWLYMDGRYIKDVCTKHGWGIPETYPQWGFWHMLYYAGWRGIVKHRPLYHLDYDKPKVKNMLKKVYGWEDYGGHHCENRLTAYYHDYFMPKHYGVNSRLMGWAAQVRTGKLSREKALQLEHEWERDENRCPEDIVQEVSVRLRETLTFKPRRTYKDYRTYRCTFRLTKPIWWLMWKLDRVPDSFYMKWCKGRGSAEERRE